MIAKILAERKDEIKHKDLCTDDFNTNQLQIERKDPPRQLHDFLHSLQEDHGDQPKALHRVRAEEEGSNRQE